MAEAAATPIAHSDSPLEAGHGPAGIHAHVVPMRVLVAVWLSLAALTVITVGVTHWDFGGSVNLWIAMGIATLKASLVILYFMHVRYDNAFYGVILLISLLFVMLFIGIALMDSEQYGHMEIPNYAPLIQP